MDARQAMVKPWITARIRRRGRFPAMPSWFGDNRDFGNIRAGLAAVGMSDSDRRNHGRQLVSFLW
jgi:hypothetical protein